MSEFEGKRNRRPIVDRTLREMPHLVANMRMYNFYTMWNADAPMVILTDLHSKSAFVLTFLCAEHPVGLCFASSSSIAASASVKPAVDVDAVAAGGQTDQSFAPCNCTTKTSYRSVCGGNAAAFSAERYMFTFTSRPNKSLSSSRSCAMP